MKKLIFSSIILLASSFSLFSIDKSLEALLNKNSSSIMAQERNLNPEVENTLAANSSIIPNPTLAMSNSDYLVTAGDVYSLQFLAGNTPVASMLTVDSTYKIRVANLGVLDATDTTFASLKKQVEAIVSRNYPMSGVQFNLVTPGTFNVVVKGEVSAAIESQAWGLTRLSTIVAATKNKYASIRNVQVTSKNGTTKTYDLFKTARFGDFSQDPYLRPGDVITLSPIEKSVTISGSIKRPGTYELQEGEGIKELIDYYGDGYLPSAVTDSVELFRIANPAARAGEKQILTAQQVEDNFELMHQDSVVVLDYQSLKPVIFIQGAISSNSLPANAAGDSPLANITDSTGTLPVHFNLGETYTFIARNNKHLFNSNADLKKAYITRGDEFIPIDLYDILYNGVENNLTVSPNDILTIPSVQLTVSVLGAVKVPGRYPFLPGKDWSYYVNLAGGFIEEKNSFDSVKIVDVNGNKHEKEEPITPETTITAKTNDFLYYFNTYAPIITTTISAVTAAITLFITFSNIGK